MFGMKERMSVLKKRVGRINKEYDSKEFKKRYGKLCYINGLGLKREDKED